MKLIDINTDILSVIIEKLNDVESLIHLKCTCKKLNKNINSLCKEKRPYDSFFLSKKKNCMIQYMP